MPHIAMGQAGRAMEFGISLASHAFVATVLTKPSYAALFNVNFAVLRACNGPRPVGSLIASISSIPLTRAQARTPAHMS